MKTIKKFFLGLLLLLALLVAGWAIQYTHTSKPDQIKSYPTTNLYITPQQVQVSAHRSGAGIMPEETMMAFQNCIETSSFSVDWYEFDLHITADDTLVLLHDEELDRTSDSTLIFGEENVPVHTKSLAELKQLNMGYKFQAEDGSFPFANATGEELESLRIATLDEVLDYLTAQGDFHYIIEIKNDGELGKRATDLLYQNLVQRNLLNKVIFGSFHDEVCAYVDKVYPDFIRAASTSDMINFIIASVLHQKDFAPSYDVLITPYGDIKENYGVNTGTANFINYAHEHNIAVFYWTINDTKQMEYLTSIGADALITDYPDKAAVYRVSR